MAHAHTADTSYLRATVSKHALELRFTFDLATLYMIDRLDRDGDGRVSREEAESGAPAIASFLTQAVTLELNGQTADLGTPQPLGWPVDAGEFIEEKNYGQSLLHFAFRQDTEKLIEDFYILYEVYAQLGAVHRTIANIEQEGKNLEVVFTQFEPDYLYDTFWRSETTPELPSFREGVHAAWSLWWLPLGTAVLAVLTARRRVAWCAAIVLEGAALLWVFFAMDSKAPPGHLAAVTGLITGLLVIVIIVWPLRLLARSLLPARAG